MKPRILIPVRPFGEGKTRLAGVLGPEERGQLAERMFRHVLGVARDFGDCFIVTREERLLAEFPDIAIRDHGDGPNAALEQAAAILAGEAPLLVLAADLPLLAAAELATMLGLLREAEVVAAPDAAGAGTNALLLARPGCVPYAFGPGSLARHRALALAGGWRFAACRLPGLARDIDSPADLGFLP